MHMPTTSACIYLEWEPKPRLNAVTCEEDWFKMFCDDPIIMRFVDVNSNVSDINNSMCAGMNTYYIIHVPRDRFFIEMKSSARTGCSDDCTVAQWQHARRWDQQATGHRDFFIDQLPADTFCIADLALNRCNGA